MITPAGIVLGLLDEVTIAHAYLQARRTSVTRGLRRAESAKEPNA